MKIVDLLENGNLGLTIFDIDETLFRTTAQIKVVKDGQVVRSLTNQEFNNYELQPGEDFDFGEFKDAEKFSRESIPIEPMIAKLKAILRNAGDSKVIMLTARSDFDNKDMFLDTFRRYGIDIDKIHVHRAGNLGGAPAENKEVFIRKYLDTGDYARVRLYDDSMSNIRMFNALSKEYPQIQFFPYFVTHEGGIKTIREGVGRIVKGVNTTVDVGPNEIKTQAAKFGNTVDRDGRPPTMSSKVRGKSTNVLFNLGLAESKKSIFRALTEAETHTVQSGDTLYGVSLQYGISIDDLQTWNELDGTNIRLGQELYVSEPEPFDPSSLRPRTRPASFFNTYERLLIRVAKSSGIQGRELAQLLAQCAHETQNYSEWVEEGSRQYFDQYEFSEVLGNTEPGDGYKYRGRGYVQLTGRYNYQQASNALDMNFIEMPDLAERPYIAAQIAVWYWNWRVRSRANDPTNTREVTRLVQGGSGGLESRQEYFTAYLNQIELINQETGDFREIESVQESFDTTADWIKDFDDGDIQVFATKIEDAYIELTYKRMSNKDVYIAFSRGGKSSVTGEGLQNQIFGAVINHITQWAAENNPPRIVFSAFKPNTGAFGSQDTTRSSLYRRMVQRFANRNGYEYDVEDTGNEDTFILTRQQNTSLEENFADGKRKGKSRPGRVKRAGASCKGSVTSLRKRAKNASGEKAKMYHWCANMKSGRKK